MNKMIHLVLALTIFAQRIVVSLSEPTIIGTNDGLGQVGSSMTLEYQSGLDKWNVCFWYRTKEGKDPENCMFVATNTANPTCQPAELSSHMTYSGTKNSSCTITIDKLTEDDGVKWEARVDAQMTNAEFVSSTCLDNYWRHMVERKPCPTTYISLPNQFKGGAGKKSLGGPRVVTMTS